MLQDLTGHHTVIGLLHTTHMLQEQASKIQEQGRRFRSREGSSGAGKEVQEQKRSFRSREGSSGAEKEVQEQKRKFRSRRGGSKAEKEVRMIF